MEFKSGMLGCCAVLLIMAGAIFGTILISADANTYDVTKYRFETEITGLFPVDNTPEFMDYDLSRNYTGYYTQNTIVDGVKYWGGATYTESTSVNNYSVKYVPDDDYTRTYNLSNYVGNMTPSDPPGNTYLDLYYYKDDPSNPTMEFRRCISYTIESLINALGLQNYGEITIYSPTNNQNDLVFFSNSELYDDQFAPVRYLSFAVSKELADQNEELSKYLACISCKIIMATRTVYFYYENTATNQSLVYTSSLDKACIIYINEDTHRTINVFAHNDPLIKYMDISKGITITGVTA